MKILSITVTVPFMNRTDAGIAMHPILSAAEICLLVRKGYTNSVYKCLSGLRALTAFLVPPGWQGFKVLALDFNRGQLGWDDGLGVPVQ